ncbi:hypothetical protein [Thalassolituus oleivorans]|uniref:hypothetical protein n=1 Tax=Thalassolituus oleivorans TaxID=187493 RepID=UPI0023F5315B|nr:hypothetical protein [Thalassolituus oleivorans]
MPYRSFIFLKKNSELSLDSLSKSLRDWNTTEVKDGLIINVRGYVFRITINNQPHVANETLELIKSTDLPGNIKTDLRIEISGEDDYDMEFFNDYLLILEKISENNGLVIFNSISNEVM